MEFQPGDQKKGMSAGGGRFGVPSIEKESGESRSSGGFGSWTLQSASIAGRPLYRCGSRGIFSPAIRKPDKGAHWTAGASVGNSSARARRTSSRSEEHTSELQSHS